ncbi:hypothetical protein ACFL6C_10865 [Myxococcota bacterium]
MFAETLEGALVTLKPVGISGLGRLCKDFQNEDLHTDAGLYNPPTEQSLREDLVDEELFICDMIPEESDKSVGYAAVIAYSGPPFVLVYFFAKDRMDLDLAQEAVLLLTHAFFQNTSEEQLWTYQVKPIDDEIHDRLIEGGFDFWDQDVPGIEHDKVACYLMERHTYDAYYGDESEEEDVDY